MRAIICLSIFLWMSGVLAQDFAPITINNWSYWQQKDGAAHSPNSSQEFATFPQGTVPVVYTDGLVWAGLLRNGNPALRAGGIQYFEVGTQAGSIVQSGTAAQPPLAEDPNQAHIYRIRHDWATVSDAELRGDAAITFNVAPAAVTQVMLDSLRQMYAQDWQNWPVDLGAPYYDYNQNGQWDAGVDEPGFASADQVIWYVVNDLDDAKTRALFGSLPIGLEVRVTLWAYKHTGGALGHTIFKRYQILNKSGLTIDSLYFGQFSEFDVGDFSDDLNGCDSTLGLGYTYNGPSQDELCKSWGVPALAAASILLQGPLTDAPGEQAIFHLQRIPNKQNLPLTAFWHKAVGTPLWDPELGSYNGTVSLFAILQGYAQVLYSGSPLYQYHGAGPQKGKATRFPVNGDPVTGSGDVDGQEQNTSPGSRRFTMSCGPVTMAPGDEQELVFATSIGMSTTLTDNLQAVADLQTKVPLLRAFYEDLPDEPLPEPATKKQPTENLLPDANTFVLHPAFPNPFNGTTVMMVDVLNAMDLEVAVFDVLGRLTRTLFKGPLAKGSHPLKWDGKDANGQAAGSGIYFVRVQNGPRMQWQKVVYLR